MLMTPVPRIPTPKEKSPRPKWLLGAKGLAYSIQTTSETQTKLIELKVLSEFSLWVNCDLTMYVPCM